VNPLLAKALDRLLILHADHEQNASTSTVRFVGCSRRHHLLVHFGGHQRVEWPAAWRCAQDGSPVDVCAARFEVPARALPSSWIESEIGDEHIKARWVYGHRVYKNYHPRARLRSKKARMKSLTNSV